MFRRKSLIALSAAVAIMTLSFVSNSFASPLIYDAKEGIGIEVERPKEGMRMQSKSPNSSIIEDGKVWVSGGTLWVTWEGASRFRANYYHSSKTHRCSVSNDHGTLLRSDWVSKGITAKTPWLHQTFTNNRAYAATK